MKRLHTLNLPPAELRLREAGGRTEVFDPFRRRYVALTPEEEVRQHFLSFLVLEKKVPASLIRVEASLKYNRLAKRSDIVVYAATGKPVMIVECKAPGVKITQETFEQAALYNSTFRVNLLVVTNGMEHYCCRVDHEKRSVAFLQAIPQFQEMI